VRVVRVRTRDLDLFTGRTLCKCAGSVCDALAACCYRVLDASSTCHSEPWDASS
jgi:hypothetical protein